MPISPIQTYLEDLSETELRALLLEFASSIPLVRQKLETRGNLQSSQSAELLLEIRSGITELGSEPDYNRRYQGYPSVDVGDLIEQLDLLLAGEHFDDLIGLAEDFMESASRAIEVSHDEGELSAEITVCFSTILAALPHSSLTSAQQLIWLTELQLEDEYDFIEVSSSDDVFWDGHVPSPRDWGVLASHLEETLVRINSKGGSDYKRGRVSRWLEEALIRSGQASGITAMLEREAERSDDFTRLVSHLISENLLEQAEIMIRRGIERSEKAAPGVANQLRDSWRKIRTQAQDWLLLTSLSAVTFFQDPTVSAYRNLETDALRTNLWGLIEPLAKQFLETGVPPQLADWSLPDLDLPMPPERRVIREQAPFFKTLFELAITENRPDDVLRWYEFKPVSAAALSSYQDTSKNRVATAIQHQYPDKAISFWQELADTAINQTGDRHYRDAIEYLEKIRMVLVQLERTNNWETLLELLGTVHKRKRLFTQMLDQLPR